MRTYSLVTRQGTAMAEATVCASHNTFDARAEGLSRALDAGDWDAAAGWVESTGNEAVTCLVCGASGG